VDVLEKSQLTSNQAFNHWYYKAKFELLMKELNKMRLSDQACLVDVGSGIGLFLTMLESSGWCTANRMFGVDTAYTSPVKAIGGNCIIYPDWRINENIGVVILMDVLEHAENDSELLENSVENLSNNGYVFITVPAFPFLWSANDVYLNHYRRYTLRSLSQTISEVSCLRIINIYYFYAAIFPAVILVRKLRGILKGEDCNNESDMKPTATLLNNILYKLCRLENRITHFNCYFGLSVVAVCQKYSVNEDIPNILS